MAETGESFQVFIAYEDLKSGLRSKAAVTRVLKELEWDVAPQVELCRFDLLRRPEVQDWAAREARQSDVVVVSAHGDGNLPDEVVEWIDRWTHEPGSPGNAIIASLDETARATAEANGTLARLRKVAAETGRNLFCHFGTTSKRVLECTVRCVRMRCERSFASEDDGTEPWRPSPRWGINE